MYIGAGLWDPTPFQRSRGPLTFGDVRAAVATSVCICVYVYVCVYIHIYIYICIVSPWLRSCPGHRHGPKP